MLMLLFSLGLVAAGTAVEETCVGDSCAAGADPHQEQNISVHLLQVGLYTEAVASRQFPWSTRRRDRRRDSPDSRRRQPCPRDWWFETKDQLDKCMQPCPSNSQDREPTSGRCYCNIGGNRCPQGKKCAGCKEGTCTNSQCVY